MIKLAPNPANRLSHRAVSYDPFTSKIFPATHTPAEAPNGITPNIVPYIVPSFFKPKNWELTEPVRDITDVHDVPINITPMTAIGNDPPIKSKAYPIDLNP
jgi:hypothetical protein